jgi:hypothetical protein
LGKFALQDGQLRDAVARVARQARAGGVGAHAGRVIIGEEELAGGGEVQRRASADGSHHLHARALAVGALVALANGQVDRLLDLLVQLAHRTECSVTHVQAAFDQIAQLKQPHAKPVAASLRAVHESPDGQVVEDAMRCRGMQARLLADLLQGDRLLA